MCTVYRLHGSLPDCRHVLQVNSNGASQNAGTHNEYAPRSKTTTTYKYFNTTAQRVTLATVHRTILIVNPVSTVARLGRFAIGVFSFFGSSFSGSCCFPDMC
eukprot:GHVS01070072.1.p2 GENE.GHVS01070072.1~~GHVS01070072.1.p2  ORF type:complete len:102 (+),score=3.89 GHVS01070072.1:210-515(+)